MCDDQDVPEGIVPEIRGCGRTDVSLIEMLHSERAELLQSGTLAVGQVLSQNPLQEVRSYYGRPKFRSIREDAV